MLGLQRIVLFHRLNNLSYCWVEMLCLNINLPFLMLMALSRKWISFHYDHDYVYSLLSFSMYRVHCSLILVLFAYWWELYYYKNAEIYYCFYCLAIYVFPILMFLILFSNTFYLLQMTGLLSIDLIILHFFS